LREEQKLQEFENKMLKKIYGPKTDKISGRQAGRQAI
jgi:hypothetical protein